MTSREFPVPQTLRWHTRLTTLLLTIVLCSMLALCLVSLVLFVRTIWAGDLWEWSSTQTQWSVSSGGGLLLSRGSFDDPIPPQPLRHTAITDFDRRVAQIETPPPPMPSGFSGGMTAYIQIASVHQRVALPGLLLLYQYYWGGRVLTLYISYAWVAPVSGIFTLLCAISLRRRRRHARLVAGLCPV